MFRLPKQYRDREVLLQRIILFTVALAMVLLYFDRILGGIGWVLGVCTPFIVGAFLAFVLDVIADNLMNFGIKYLKVRDNRGTRFLSNVLAILVLVALIVVFVFVLFPRIAESFQSMMNELPASLNEMYATLLKKTANIPLLYNWISSMDFSAANISATIEGFFAWLTDTSSADIVGSLYSVISSAFSYIFNTFVALMFSLIVLFNKKRVAYEGRQLLRAYLPARFYERILHIGHLIFSTFRSYIGGSCLECLILATLVAVFSTIFRLPWALLSGLVVGIGALVPMFGALVAAILVALFISLESPVQGLTFLIMFICIQQVEGNFIYPNVVGKSVGLPPMYVIVAVTLGANIAGILGMIVFIPVVSCVYQIIKEDVQARLKNRRRISEEEEPE